MYKKQKEKEGSSEDFVEEIKEILVEYKIGKKPLAKLLGWGETTIIRYIDGDIPTREYLEKLNEIHCNPNYYYSLLQNNQDKLTNVAYKKSKKAVLEKIIKTKIKLFAQYIINEANADITVRKVQVILYYAQVLSLTMFQKPLFEEKCQITYNMMPYLEVYECMKTHGIRILELEEDCICTQEKQIVSIAMEAFEWYSSKAARRLLLKEREESNLERWKDSEKKISNEILQQCYTKIFEQYQVHQLEDFKTYVKNRVCSLICEK